MKRVFWIACRSALLAGLLLSVPVGLVQFGARQAEEDIATGNLIRAEHLLSVFGPLGDYPLLPVLAKARVHGVRCELAAAQGRKDEAKDHFLTELQILAGQLQLKADLPSESPPAFLKHRKGIEAWRKGYREWLESTPESPPDFDREFLPEEDPATGEATSRPPVFSWEDPGSPRKLYSGELPVPPSDQGGGTSPLHKLYHGALRGEMSAEIALFLEKHADNLVLAHEWADRSGPRVIDLDGLPAASDAFRLLLLDFLFRAQNGDESGAVEALGRCGRALRAMEQAPSILSIGAICALRSDWLKAVEGSLDTSGPSPETKQDFIEVLTQHAFDPAYPARCVRREYAEFKTLMTGAYLGGSWKESSPNGRHLFTRQMELGYDRHRRLAEVLSPETAPEAADAIFLALADSDGVTAALLAPRSPLAELCYGTRELTEADGKRYAEAMIDCNAAIVEGTARLRLGPLGSSLHELRTREADLIGRLSAGEAR